VHHPDRKHAEQGVVALERRGFGVLGPAWLKRDPRDLAVVGLAAMTGPVMCAEPAFLLHR
jgi:hypothetical protein